MARGTCAVVDVGLDGCSLADFEAGYAFSDFDDCAREFVAQGDWDGFLSDGVRLKGCKVGTSEVLVQIWEVSAMVLRQGEGPEIRRQEKGDMPVPQMPTKAGLILICPGLHTGSSISSIRISPLP